MVLNKFQANFCKGKINEEESKTYFLSICDMEIGYNHGSSILNQTTDMCNITNINGEYQKCHLCIQYV